MSGRIIVLGATGYTGGLITDSLVARGERPLLAARNEARLAAVADRHGGLETEVVDVMEDSDLDALLDEGDVLISAVGPFERFGWKPVAAAVLNGAHYLDTTGEVGFVREIRATHDSAARAAGVTIVPAFGYDYVPGNLAGALAAQRAGDAAARLDVAYFMTGEGGAISSGTRATMLDGLLKPSLVRRYGKVTDARAGSSVRAFEVGGRRREAVLGSGTEVLDLPAQFPTLATIEVFIGWFGRMSRAVSLLTAALDGIASTRLGRAPVTRMLDSLRPKETGGPGAEARTRNTSDAVAVASDAHGGSLASVHLTGPNTYTVTGELLAEGAIALRDGKAKAAGVVGPVSAFGVDGLTELCGRAGLHEAE